MDLEAETGETPEAIAAMPVLRPDLAEYLRAFNILSPCRVQGLAVSGIPIAEILAYADLHSFDPGERPALVRWIRFLDSEWMKLTSEKKP